MTFDLLVGVASVLAGVIAAVAGFGVGSLLTPLFALRVDTKLAVAAVAVPHAVGTAVRFWLLRRDVDRRVLWTFGVTSAIGGLIGALIHRYASSLALTLVFGSLLVFAGVSELTGLIQHLRLGPRAAWAAGALSGLLGGLVGNQGGIRSAAMLGFDVPKRAFVATATATALFVDAARLPVYVTGHGAAIASIWPVVSIATAGVVAGTLAGTRILSYITEAVFKRLVAALILTLGAAMLIGAMG